MISITIADVPEYLHSGGFYVTVAENGAGKLDPFHVPVSVFKMDYGSGGGGGG
jgi:hypothetical protein